MHCIIHLIFNRLSKEANQTLSLERRQTFSKFSSSPKGFINQSFERRKKSVLPATSSKILDKEGRGVSRAFSSAQSVKHRPVALIEADRIGAVNRQECRPVKSLPSYAIIIVAPFRESLCPKICSVDLGAPLPGPARSSHDVGTGHMSAVRERTGGFRAN